MLGFLVLEGGGGVSHGGGGDRGGVGGGDVCSLDTTKGVRGPSFFRLMVLTILRGGVSHGNRGGRGGVGGGVVCSLAATGVCVETSSFRLTALTILLCPREARFLFEPSYLSPSLYTTRLM